ncbi:MAG: uracil-DNA glycosylase [Gammaproteobacteria bacterium]|jgi:DNA polymerase|nr:uracil-DNA glycosylase [Gammaproteobacteria bacterium]
MADSSATERRAMILAELGIEQWRLRGQPPAAALGPAAAARSEAGVAPGRQVPEPPPVAAVAAGEPAARPVSDWSTLNHVIRTCTRCALHQSRTQAVCGVGAERAEWLIVGEAPGAEEDARGEPFVGRAGQLLDQMLLALGLQRDAVFIANVLKCRPPKNRNPTADEMAACRPHLDKQIELLQPRLILAVGAIAARSLLGVDPETPVGKLRGTVHKFGPRQIPLVVTYHPAYLLRRPLEKRRSWDDLLLAQAQYGALESPEPP